MPSALDAMLTYARRGWRGFPIEPRGKRPLTNHGCKDGTTDTITLTEWARRWPGCNWGVATGTVSGIWALDIDGQDGRAALAALMAQHGPLTRSVCQGTGSGGWHVLYDSPDGRPIRNSAGKLGPHLDTRGDGGYIVVAPSIHPNGTPYRWCRGAAPWQRPLAEAPGWLLDLVDPPRPERVVLPPVAIAADRGYRYGRAALDRALRELEQAGNGQRNCTLNNVALGLGQLIPAGYLDYTEVASELEASAVAIGLDVREAGATIRSGLSAGQREPRYLAAG